MTQTQTKQIATLEFCEWLKTTAFAGIINPGEQWDTESAWPNDQAMWAARNCFTQYTEYGATGEANIYLIEAQRALEAQ